MSEKESRKEAADKAILANANGKVQPEGKAESMTAAEAQAAWMSLRVHDGGGNPGNAIEVDGVLVTEVLRGYNGITFVPQAGKDTLVYDPAEKVSVKMPNRADLDVENNNGELDG